MHHRPLSKPLDGERHDLESHYQVFSDYSGEDSYVKFLLIAFI